MRQLRIIAAALIIVATSAGMASARRDVDEQNHYRPNAPDNALAGATVLPAGPSQGQRVDYRANGLRRPPFGYEWRTVGGTFLLARIGGNDVPTVRR